MHWLLSTIGLVKKKKNENTMNVNLLFYFPCVAVVWQLMRAYTISLLQKLANSDSPITDQEIVNWVNEMLSHAEKSSSIASFKVGWWLLCVHIVSFVTW